MEAVPPGLPVSDVDLVGGDPVGGDPVGGDPGGWDAPPRRLPDPSAAPVLVADGFEGPLDWLLEMARARKIDLLKVPVLSLIETFAAGLAEALLAMPNGDHADARSGADLARWGGWLVMAADLALLRSRLLAPVGAAEAKEAESAAERLRRQIVGRAETDAAADWLDRRVLLGRDVFSRGASGDGVRGGRTGDVVGLLRACLVALALPADSAVYRIPAPPFWSVSQASARIRSVLPELGEAGGELGVFLPPVAADVPERDRRCRSAVASTLVAALELAREGVAALTQDSANLPIRIHQSE